MKSNKKQNKFIKLDTSKCIACWLCINECPTQVIDEVIILWHKHIVLKHADKCIGCYKCISVCPRGVISKLTIFGGLFLAVIAIIPMLLRFTSLNVSFGGTSILIVVGVALETVQQLESQLVMRHYKGFLE